MTIRKRLFWSNILMIVVPVAVSGITALVCMGIVWLALSKGLGLGIHDQDEFYIACEMIDEAMENDSYALADYSSVQPILENNGMTMRVFAGDREVYSYGNQMSGDAALYEALSMLDDGSTVTEGDRVMYVSRTKENGTSYSVYLAGSFVNVHSYKNVKTAACIAVAIIILTVLFSVIITNRLLTRLVLRRIEEPLDILANGVNELARGRLEYRIDYDRRDEFASVCRNFNDMAEQLEKSMDRIKKQEQSRKELIAGISHDIRSPLTSIQAYVEGLIDGIADTPERQQLYLQTIRRKAEELSRMVSQLFLFSKMELGEYTEHPRQLRLDETIMSILDGIRDEYREKGMGIKTELVPALVYADPVQLERIVMNIVGNSLKYKSGEEGHIEVCMETGRNECSVSFADDGPGVSMVALGHLFEVFYRDDPARTNTSDGSGLGLAIVAHAVEHMNGHVEAAARDGGGLVITVRLPLCGGQTET